MDVQVSIDLHGVDQLLVDLGPKLAKKALRKALKEAAEIWVDSAKEHAPVDTGDLRESIASVIYMSSSQEQGRASVGPTHSAETVKAAKSSKSSISSQDPGVYGIWVELGLKSRKYTATPYLRPAFEGQSNAVIAKFAEVLKQGLEEVTASA